MPGIVINNLIKQEDVANQRAPLDHEIFAEINRAAKTSHLLNSDRNLLFDILTFARFIGPRFSEYAQTTQDRVDYHVYPNGNRVIKAFIANNFVFCNDKNNILLLTNRLWPQQPWLRLLGESRRIAIMAKQLSSRQTRKTSTYAQCKARSEWS
jgi:hypothetical protein